MTVLVTGCAGFIGYHTCVKLLRKKIVVYGIDNINTYYDISLKKIFTELEHVPLKKEVLPRFLGENAKKLLKL